MDLKVIGNPVFTLSRDLFFPDHVIIRTKDQNGGTFYPIVCNTCKYNIAYQIGHSFDFTMLGNPFPVVVFTRC